MADSRATILSILSVPFEENSYLAQLDGRSDCLVVDPGLEPDKILTALEEKSWTPAAILCTHGHADHIAGNKFLKDRFPNCPLVIGEGDAPKLRDPVANLSAGFGINLFSPPADRKVREGELLEYAGFKLEVLETPGHSTGHVVFVASHLSPIHVFGGDVLFAGSIGRTDFPDGSFEDLRTAIHESFFRWPTTPSSCPVTARPRQSARKSVTTRSSDWAARTRSIQTAGTRNRAVQFGLLNRF